MSERVVVGMSGGVDSSVAALLLKQQGYDVVGLFMKNWEERDADGVCPAERDFEDVARVCERLDIPYTSVNFAREYADRVFEGFVRDYARGVTPNPDVLCNREIKFDLFAQHARALGADWVATGHYARLHDGDLLKAVDLTKDQSYFLHAVPRDAFRRVLFPLGEIPKSRVRELALEAGLATARKKDSTGICFIGERRFKEFLSRYVAARPGEVRELSPGAVELSDGSLSEDGVVVGRHDGAAFYTLGQRKGLRIGGTAEPYFVVRKDPVRNIVYVARGGDHPLLHSEGVTVVDVNWLAAVPPPVIGEPVRVGAKLRYRQEDQWAWLVRGADGAVSLRFESPQRAATPGQYAVFYDGERCLGGGLIERVVPARSVAAAGLVRGAVEGAAASVESSPG